MNKYPACLNVGASVMDSAHAEPLASEAWRNICDTFLLTVSPLAAAAPAKQGLSLPQRAHANSHSHSPDYRRTHIYRCCFVAFSSGFSVTAIFGVNVKKKMDVKIVQFFFTSSKRGHLTFLKGSCWIFYQRNYPSIHLSSIPFSPALRSLGLEEPIPAVIGRGQGTWKSCRVCRRAT